MVRHSQRNGIRGSESINSPTTLLNMSEVVMGKIWRAVSSRPWSDDGNSSQFTAIRKIIPARIFNSKHKVQKDYSCARLVLEYPGDQIWGSILTSAVCFTINSVNNQLNQSDKWPSGYGASFRLIDTLLECCICQLMLVRKSVGSNPTLFNIFAVRDELFRI
jgi:hypothetical protein